MDITYRDIAMALPQSVKERAMAEAKSSLADGEKVTYSLILAHVTDEEYEAAVEVASSGASAAEPKPKDSGNSKPDGDEFDAKMTDAEAAASKNAFIAWIESLDTAKKVMLGAGAVVTLALAALLIVAALTPKEAPLSAASLEGSYALSSVVADGVTLDVPSWREAGRQESADAAALAAFASAPLTVARSTLDVVWLPFSELLEAADGVALPKAVKSALSVLANGRITESMNGQAYISDQVGNRVEIYFDESRIAINLTPLFTDYNDSIVIVFSRVDEMSHQSRLTAYNEVDDSSRSQASKTLLEMLVSLSRLGTPLGSTRLDAIIEADAADISIAPESDAAADGSSDESADSSNEAGVDDSAGDEIDVDALLSEEAVGDEAVDEAA